MNGKEIEMLALEGREGLLEEEMHWGVLEKIQKRQVLRGKMNELNWLPSAIVMTYIMVMSCGALL